MADCATSRPHDESPTNAADLDVVGCPLLIVVLPFLGTLIYMIVRPKMTEQDRQLIAAAQGRQHRQPRYSAAEEIERLAKLRDERTISAEEFEVMKQKAMA